MTEHKKSVLRRAGSFFVSYLTPWGGMKRSADSVKKSASNIMDAARGARDSMRADHERIQAAKQVQLTPEQRRMTPEQLFRDRYEQLGWNEDTLAWNRRQFRRAKWACMSAAAVSLAGGLGAMSLAEHPIVAFVMGPTFLIMSLFTAGRGALEAWKQAQIDLRSVADFKWFLSQPDFFKRLVV